MAASPRYLQLLQEMEDLHLKKAAGYSGQDNPDTWSNFREAELWGVAPLRGCLVRLGDKYRRVQSLIRDPSNGQLPEETLKDTLMDMAAYSLIAICLLEEQEATAHRLGLRD